MSGGFEPWGSYGRTADRGRRDVIHFLPTTEQKLEKHQIFFYLGADSLQLTFLLGSQPRTHTISPTGFEWTLKHPVAGRWQSEEMAVNSLHRQSIDHLNNIFKSSFRSFYLTNYCIYCQLNIYWQVLILTKSYLLGPRPIGPLALVMVYHTSS